MSKETVTPDGWMQEEIKATIEKNLSKEELIRELSVNLLQYGMECIAETLSCTKEHSEKNLLSLHKQIITNGATPRVKLVIDTNH